MLGYFSNMRDSVRKAVRNATSIVTIAAGIFAGTFADLYSQDNSPSRNETTHAVRAGDSMWDIAENNLEKKGDTPTLQEIVNETNRISTINGMGTIAEFPHHEGYDCSDASPRDPNCILEGEEIVVSRDYSSVENALEETSKENNESDYKSEINESSELPADSDDNNFWLLAGIAGGLVAAGAGAYALSRKKEEYKEEPVDVYFEKEKKETDSSLKTMDTKFSGLEDLIQKRNEDPYKTIDDFKYEANGLEFRGEELKGMFEHYFDTYKPGKAKLNRYDSSIAPSAMKKEMVEAYANSEKSLKEVAEDLGNKYGMSVSSTTISRHAREELGVKNRKEAKELEKEVEKSEGGESMRTARLHPHQVCLGCV